MHQSIIFLIVFVVGYSFGVFVAQPDEPQMRMCTLEHPTLQERYDKLEDAFTNTKKNHAAITELWKECRSGQ